jgi:hypothetical protein
LIGPSESGKSNVLLALSKFETGQFTIEDVPRRQISPEDVDPPYDLPMVSVTCELEEKDISDKVEGNYDSGDLVKFARTYRGPIALEVTGASRSRKLSEVIADIREVVPTFRQNFRRYAGAYNRARKKIGSRYGRDTNRLSVRTTYFESLALDRARQSESSWLSELQTAFQRVRSSLHSLSSDVRDLVPNSSANLAEDSIISMETLVEELGQSDSKDSDVGDLYLSRPRFKLVTSEISDWLTGEYEIGEG